MKRLLVLTDFSQASERAERQAEYLALAFGAEVHLLHKVIYPLPQPPTELLAHLDDAREFETVLLEGIERPEREAQAGLEERAEQLRSRGIRTETRLERSGDAYDAAESAVEALHPDLIVMGTHGRSGIQKFLMGSVAEKVLRHVKVDVLTLREDAPPAAPDGSLKEVLVPTDFSAASRRALDVAFSWARDLSGSVSLLHVMEEQFRPRGEGAEPSLVEVSSELKAEAERALDAELQGREGRVLLAEGNVARTIVGVASERGASLVVQGSRGRGGFSQVFLGSVAEKVARSCHVPVLTVR